MGVGRVWRYCCVVGRMTGKASYKRVTLDEASAEMDEFVVAVQQQDEQSQGSKRILFMLIATLLLACADLSVMLYQSNGRLVLAVDEVQRLRAEVNKLTASLQILDLEEEDLSEELQEQSEQIDDHDLETKELKDKLAQEQALRQIISETEEELVEEVQEEEQLANERQGEIKNLQHEIEDLKKESSTGSTTKVLGKSRP